MHLGIASAAIENTRLAFVYVIFISNYDGRHDATLAMLMMVYDDDDYHDDDHDDDDDDDEDDDGDCL